MILVSRFNICILIYMQIDILIRSLGAIRAQISSRGPSGLLHFVLHALGALRPCDSCSHPSRVNTITMANTITRVKTITEANTITRAYTITQLTLTANTSKQATTISQSNSITLANTITLVNTMTRVNGV